MFLAEGGGNTLTLTDKVTAVGDIIRQRLQNGVLLTSAPTHDGTISMATAPNTFRNLLLTEGSLTDGLGSTPNPNWHTVSIGTYNGYIRNGGCPTPTTCAVPPRGTGAKPLNLALLTVGGTNTDLARRPQKNEDVNNSVLFGERMFAKKDGMSLRILLSDTPSNITNLPTVTATAADSAWRDRGDAGRGLEDDAAVADVWAPAWMRLHPPIARSPGTIPATFKTNGTTNGTGDTTIPFSYKGALSDRAWVISFTCPTCDAHGHRARCNNVTCTQRDDDSVRRGARPRSPGSRPTGAHRGRSTVTVNGVVTYTPQINVRDCGRGRHEREDLHVVTGPANSRTLYGRGSRGR